MWPMLSFLQVLVERPVAVTRRMQFLRFSVAFAALCIAIHVGGVSSAKKPKSSQARMPNPPDLPPGRTNPPRNLTFLEVYESLESCTLVLVDVRNASEYYINPGHIPGSFNVPLSELADAFDRTVIGDKEFYIRYGFNRPEKPGSEMAVMCLAGVRAGRAISTLAELGYTDVNIYGEGLRGWSIKGGRYCKYGPVPLPDTTVAVTPPKSRSNHREQKKRPSSKHRQYDD